VGRLNLKDPFPELILQSLDGEIDLRDRRREGPLVVAFMRHFG
jgi:hypothetical protein